MVFLVFWQNSVPDNFMDLPKGIYKHYKGNLYQVLVLARHSETEEEMVVYQTLYGNFDFWVRPRSMFEETLERDGKTVRRFELVKEFE